VRGEKRKQCGSIYEGKQMDYNAVINYENTEKTVKESVVFSLPL
jgi:hypothetical protein